jgi:hypothetical protein
MCMSSRVSLYATFYKSPLELTLCLTSTDHFEKEKKEEQKKEKNQSFYKL